MCLYTLFKKPLVAEEDLTCYKVVHIEKRFNGLVKIITTPYTDKKYYSAFGMLNGITIKAGDRHKPLELHQEYDSVYSKYYDVFSVDTQGVHCFDTLEDAKDVLKNRWFFNNMEWEKFCTINIVKCTIPKGTRYWRNTEYVGKEYSRRSAPIEIAAEKLVLHIEQ